jgi:hypothetical protein
MPLLQTALAVTEVVKSIVMAASDSARLDVVFRYQLHAIVADIARCYCSRQVDCDSSQPSLEILEMIDLCDKNKRTTAGSSSKHQTVENRTVLAKAHRRYQTKTSVRSLQHRLHRWLRGKEESGNEMMLD